MLRVPTKKHAVHVLPADELDCPLPTASAQLALPIAPIKSSQGGYSHLFARDWPVRVLPCATAVRVEPEVADSSFW